MPDDTQRWTTCCYANTWYVHDDGDIQCANCSNITQLTENEPSQEQLAAVAQTVEGIDTNADGEVTETEARSWLGRVWDAITGA